MSMVATLNGVLSRQKEVVAHGTIAFSGSYTTGGEAFDFLLGPYTRGSGRNSNNRILWTTQQPYAVNIVGKAGYAYVYDAANKKLLVMQGAAAANPAAEIPAGAYVAGITGDTIRFVVVFEK